MTFEEALAKSLVIMDNHPNYILCGSVGLILTNSIKKRDIHDLDFACYWETFDDSIIIKLKKVRFNYDSVCCRINEDVFGDKYDVFVHKNTLRHKYIDNIKVQLPEDMLHYKKLCNREKDIEDLKGE